MNIRSDSISVIIPTYNEKDNVVPLIREILDLNLPLRILVVDDNSPDKTAEVVKEVFSRQPAVQVYVRSGRRGRGWAGVFGYREALKKDSVIIGEMDADFSHHPKFIPDLIAALRNADVVIGSRYLPNGLEEKRSFIRRMISRFAHFYLYFLLGIRLTDPTSGFRFFRREALKSIVDKLKAKDPFIITEVVYHLQKQGFRIAEVPIVFYPRRAGKSKLRVSTLIKYLFKVCQLRLESNFS